jgi:hypothetical protein
MIQRFAGAVSPFGWYVDLNVMWKWSWIEGVLGSGQKWPPFKINVPFQNVTYKDLTQPQIFGHYQR